MISFVLFVGASIGHVAILVYSLNWWYGLPLPRRLLSALKLFHGMLVLAGVAAFAYAWAFSATPQQSIAPETASHAVASGYVILCAVIGFIIVPFISLRRNLRRRPPIVASNHTSTFDVAGKLGFRPVGRSKHRLLAHLPGNEIFKVDFAERVLYLPRLPSDLDGLTILHLSDLHFSGTPDRIFYQEVMRRCREWDPDLVALTGDYVDSPYYHRWILPVLGWLRWRIACYAILGNQDRKSVV